MRTESEHHANKKARKGAFFLFCSMAYNENILNRVREVLLDRDITFSEKKMFMGVCIMVDDKLLCGTHTDKRTGEDVLLCRLGEEDYANAVERDEVLPMQMGTKVMKGYVAVTAQGIKKQQDLEYWLGLCLQFNPLAKSSKKK